MGILHVIPTNVSETIMKLLQQKIGAKNRKFENLISLFLSLLQ